MRNLVGKLRQFSKRRGRAIGPREGYPITISSDNILKIVGDVVRVRGQRVRGQRTCPPSSSITVPFTNSFASANFTADTTSSILPSRFSGTEARISFSFAAATCSLVEAVSI